VHAAVKHDRVGLVTDFLSSHPSSRWEYLVTRAARGSPLRLVATVRPDEFKGPTVRAAASSTSIWRSTAGERLSHRSIALKGFPPQVMSLEYRGESLEETGLRSGS